MKKAILCIGNPMRGDDDVGNEVGRIVEQELKEVKVSKQPLAKPSLLDSQQTVGISAAGRFCFSLALSSNFSS